VLTYIVSYLLIPVLSGDGRFGGNWRQSFSCGTLAGAVHSRTGQSIYFDEFTPRPGSRQSSREGAPRFNILSGLVAGNFLGLLAGHSIVGLMGVAFIVSTMGHRSLWPPRLYLLFGLVAFGFLGMGPVTIAVDSYGPVTDNAQSVFELSLIEQVPNIHEELKTNFHIDAVFERAKHLLERNDGAGNTFKATASRC